MKFEIVGEIDQIETIGFGRGVRVRTLLRKVHGPGRWRKRKGVARVRLPSGAVNASSYTGTKLTGIGRRDFKIKAYLD